MSVLKKNNKEQKQLAVAKATLDLIEKNGFLGVTHSQISRKSGVSRAWIYEYIGKEKRDIVEFASEVLAKDFSRMHITQVPQSRVEIESFLQDGLTFLFDSAVNNPNVTKIYFRYRGTQNPIGQVIHKYESLWLQNGAQGLTKILKIPNAQASLIVESALVCRLGFAHRIATDPKPEDARERAEVIFALLHAQILGFLSD
jgi:hypothetical protein